MSRWQIFIIYCVLNAFFVLFMGSDGKTSFFQCYYIGAVLLTHYLSNRSNR